MSGVRIEDIKDVCGVSEKAISVNEQGNSGMIRVETYEECRRIEGKLPELLRPFQTSGVITVIRVIDHKKKLRWQIRLVENRATYKGWFEREVSGAVEYLNTYWTR